MDFLNGLFYWTGLILWGLLALGWVAVVILSIVSSVEDIIDGVRERKRRKRGVTNEIDETYIDQRQPDVGYKES